MDDGDLRCLVFTLALFRLDDAETGGRVSAFIPVLPTEYQSGEAE
jgi:hypothetical protein